MRRVLGFAGLVLMGIGTHAWAQSTPEYAQTFSYKTTKAPTIDGVPEPGEWDAAGPWLVVNSENSGVDGGETGELTDDVHGGDVDSSFRFKTMWLEDTWQLFFLFDITDDIAATEQPREGRNWERDQIELFFDGTNLEGDSDTSSYVFWNASGNPEPYGKFGVSRENLFEGNPFAMTDDQELWDEFDVDAPLLSVSNTSDTGVNGNFYIEYGITLEGMFEDLVNNPFEGTPTEAAEHIVQDSTKVKFTVAYSDDDDIDFSNPATDRAHGLLYYRKENGEWNDSTTFSDLIFTGTYVGPSCQAPVGGILGDLDGDGEVAFADFLTLSGNFGKSGDLAYADGDIDCNGAVEFADFLTLSGNFGKSAVGAAAVPEPSAWGLLVGLAGLCVVVGRRARH